MVVLLLKKLYYLIIGLIKSLFQRRKKMVDPIDFVVLWVDGNDPEWLKEKEKYEREYNVFKKGNGAERYRDWDQFKYWFRGVEKFAPWVRNVYLVTNGQVPSWLNLDNPKLRLVLHKEIMNNDFLPTFNSSAIELHLHNIRGLSEHFVYFNDDMLLTNYVEPEDFFQDGKPLICGAGYPVRNFPTDALWNHCQFTIMGLVNKYDWVKAIMNMPEKWFNVRYGSLLRYSWRIFEDSYMYGLYDTHLAAPYKKSVIEKTWQEFPDEMNRTASNRFRTHTDVTQHLFKIQSVFLGDFVPCSPKHFGHFFFFLSRYYKSIVEDIRNQKYKIVCLNDSYDVNNDNFDIVKESLNNALEAIMPEKSSFEK